MEDFTIASFKYGVDTRRDALTSQPGTLLSGENLHLTPGGELEKRLAFAGRTLMATGVGNWFPILLPTDAGPTFFGGSAPADVTPAAGLTYQRLTHPAVTEGETYSALLHAITAIKSTATFDGKALVAATFADNNTFLYYDGTLVNQSRNGLVLTGLADLADLATQLAAEVNRIQDWVGLPNVDKDGNVVNGSVVVKSPPTIYFAPVPEVNSVNGFLGETLIDLDVDPIPENRAFVSFAITQVGPGTLGVTASSSSDPGVSDMSPISAGQVASGVDATATAAAVAARINSTTVSYGYTALSEGTTVRIFAPVGWGALANVKIVSTQETGGVSTGAGGVVPPTTLSVVLEPAQLTIQIKKILNGVFMGFGQAKVVASGGVGPYTYTWSKVSGFDNINQTNVANTNTAVFQATPGVTNGGTATWKCVVNDTGSPATKTVQLVITVIGLTNP